MTHHAFQSGPDAPPIHASWDGTTTARQGDSWISKTCMHTTPGVRRCQQKWCRSGECLDDTWLLPCCDPPCSYACALALPAWRSLSSDSLAQSLRFLMGSYRACKHEAVTRSQHQGYRAVLLRRTRLLRRPTPQMMRTKSVSQLTSDLVEPSTV